MEQLFVLYWSKKWFSHALSQQSPFLLILCNKLWFLINMQTLSLAYFEPGSKWKMSPIDGFRFSWARRSVFVTNPASILSLNDYPTTLWTFALFLSEYRFLSWFSQSSCDLRVSLLVWTTYQTFCSFLSLTQSSSFFYFCQIFSLFAVL